MSPQVGVALILLAAVQGPVAQAGFITAQTYTLGNPPSSLAVGDFNGDGYPDLAVAEWNSGTVLVLLGSGDGTFQAAESYRVGGSCYSVAVGDVNGDGYADLVAAADGNNPISNLGLSVLLGNGDGTFQYGYTIPSGAGFTSVAIGDFNGDGYQDIAVANYAYQITSFHPPSGYLIESDVVIFLGFGDGEFQATNSYALGSFGTIPSATSVAVGDFNGDGIPDLAATTPGDMNTVNVLLGNGDGTFQKARKYAFHGAYASSVAVGDLNGDGTPDLVVAYQYGVSVLLGRGDGTFQAAQNYANDDENAFVAIGDFNGDGVLDLAVANFRDNTVSVLLGNGDGTFQSAQSYAVGSGPMFVTVGDFNGDGYPDLAVANKWSGTVTVLLNTGIWP